MCGHCSLYRSCLGNDIHHVAEISYTQLQGQEPYAAQSDAVMFAFCHPKVKNHKNVLLQRFMQKTII